MADKRKFKNAALGILATFVLKTFYFIDNVRVYLLHLLNINPFGEIYCLFTRLVLETLSRSSLYCVYRRKHFER